jgi:hypothetical protein
MQRAYIDDELTSTRNRLVVLVVVLVALAIINGLAFRFPNATEHVIGSFFIGNLIQASTLAIMLILVIPLRNYLDTVVRYYMHSGYNVDEHAESAKTGANINNLSRGLANIVAIAITWVIVLQLVGQLLLIEGSGDYDWIDIIIYVSFGILLAYFVVITFGVLLAVLGIGNKSSKTMPCPKCKTSNSANASFCTSCGETLHPPQTASVSSRCTKCGKKNKSGAKFCESCGTSLGAPKQV